MHRSGTSSLAGTFAKLGIAHAATPIPDHPSNRLGHWESAPVVALNDQILASARSNWRDARPFDANWYTTPMCREFKALAKIVLAQEFEGVASFVLKDPRICRFAPFWFDVLSEQGIECCTILPVRTPSEVAQSLYVRDGSTLKHGELLWLRHVLDAEAVTRAHKRQIVLWDTFLDDWRAVVSQSQRLFDTALPHGQEAPALEVDAFLSHELRHQSGASQPMHPWCAATFAAMREAQDALSSAAAAVILDNIRGNLNDASDLFAS
jgi:hypothetical protein